MEENFSKCLKGVLSLWKKKIRNDKLIDDLYVATAKLVEFSLGEKDLNYLDKLDNDEKSDLVKFFYMTYERFTKKQNCLTLKPAKIYNVHHSILTSEGVGIVHRALFSIQK